MWMYVDCATADAWVMSSGFAASGRLAVVIFVTPCYKKKGHEWLKGPSAANGHVDVCSPCYHRSPRGCQWSGLWPEAMLMSEGLRACTSSETWLCPRWQLPWMCESWYTPYRRASPVPFQLQHSSPQLMASDVDEVLILPWGLATINLTMLH